MKLIDFSNSKLDNRYYGGSERKIGVVFNGERYMLKFQKKTPLGVRNNHISEYIGSHLFNMLGVAAQETELGLYKGETIVACKDFLADGYIFVPFNDIGESTIETSKEKFQYSYDDVVTMLELNRKLTNVHETLNVFFETFIIDAFIGNFDRHGNNWGFIKKDNKYKLSPVFDNGSSLFPSLVDPDQINYLLQSEEEINKRVYEFPTSQIKINNKKSSYYDVISSLEFPLINNALLKIYPKINMDEIYIFIESIEIDDILKCFYKKILYERYNKILKYSYDKLVTKCEKI